MSACASMGESAPEIFSMLLLRRVAILEKVRVASSYEFRRSLEGMTNPYGDGRASETIVGVLTQLVLGANLLMKHRRFLTAISRTRTDAREIRIPLSAPDITEAESMP